MQNFRPLVFLHEMFEFRLNFPEIYSRIPIDKKSTLVTWLKLLASNMRQAIIWTNDDLVFWRTNSSLGLNELN